MSILATVPHVRFIIVPAVLPTVTKYHVKALVFVNKLSEMFAARICTQGVYMYIVWLICKMG